MIVCEAGLTISGKKSSFAMPAIVIVGYLCDADGHHPEPAKVRKIVGWPPCRNITEAWGFAGICAYYRVWIEGFAVIMKPIYQLFKKGVEFKWGESQQQAMDIMKGHLTMPPVLQSPDYSPKATPLIMSMDASSIGYGGVLGQEDAQGRQYVCRYESGIWNDTERHYDVMHWECNAVMRVLKKFHIWLWGQHFILEMDSRTLTWILNQLLTDLPNMVMTRWIAYIHLFDFEVRHVPGKVNLAADALSQRGPVTGNDSEEEDIEKFLDAEIANVQVESHWTVLMINVTEIWFDPSEYEGNE